MNMPGIKAKHAIITPHCRIVQGGPLEAFREAARRLEQEYMHLLDYEANGEASFHLLLSVERPDKAGRR